MDTLGSLITPPKLSVMMPANIGPNKRAAGRASHSQKAVQISVMIKSEAHCICFGNFDKLTAVLGAEGLEIKGGIHSYSEDLCDSLQRFSVLFRSLHREFPSLVFEELIRPWFVYYIFTVVERGAVLILSKYELRRCTHYLRSGW